MTSPRAVPFGERPPTEGPEPGQTQVTPASLTALSLHANRPLQLALLLAGDSAANSDLPASVRADFGTIGKHLELVARLLDDLQEPSRILQGVPPLAMRAFDLHLALQDGVALVRSDLEARHLVLDLAFSVQPPVVWGDEARLRQLFWYVLKHAADQTPVSGRIRVQTHCPAGRGQVEVTVCHDTQGLGAGPGLALACASRIAELHSGRLRATTAGRTPGIEYTLELPLNPAPVPRAPGEAGRPSTFEPGSTPPASPPGVRPRILLVDDHAPTRNTLAQSLGRRHYEVLTAASVAEGRARGASGELQLLISDIGLPDGDGCRLMSELRQSHPELPGIALSGYGLAEDIARSRDAGFNEHLVKPVNLRALEAAICRILTPSETTAPVR